MLCACDVLTYVSFSNALGFFFLDCLPRTQKLGGSLYPHSLEKQKISMLSSWMGIDSYPSIFLCE
jgi:hypothetical protein